MLQRIMLLFDEAEELGFIPKSFPRPRPRVGVERVHAMINNTEPGIIVMTDYSTIN